MQSQLFPPCSNFCLLLYLDEEVPPRKGSELCDTEAAIKVNVTILMLSKVRPFLKGEKGAGSGGGRITTAVFAAVL